MKLVRLRLRNFRQHADSLIDFDGGMTAIVGANGSGKSTLVEAIGFALYGEQRDTREHVRFYWAEAKGMSVSLSFDFDGRRFEVERKSNDAVLKERGDRERVWATGLRPVSEACERLLGLSYEQFKNSFLAEQKGLAFLQFGTKRARQEEVARMLGFDRLRRAEEIAAVRRTTLAGQVAALETSLGDPDEAVRRRTEAAALVTGVDKELRRTTSVLRSLKRSQTKAAKEAGEARRWLERNALLRQAEGIAGVLSEALSDAAVQLEAARRDLQEFEAIEPAEKRGQMLDGQLEQMAKAREANAERESVRRAIEEIERTWGDRLPPDFPANTDRVSRAEAVHRAALDRWQAAKLEAESTRVAAAVRVESAERALAASERALTTGICPECGQPTGPAYRAIVEERTREVHRLRDELKRASDRVDRSGTAPSEVVSAEEAVLRSQAALERSRLLGRLEALPDDWDPNAETLLVSQLEALEPLRRRYVELRNAPDQVRLRERMLEEARGRFETAEAERRRLDAELGKLQFDETSASQAIAVEAERLRDLAVAEAQAIEKQAQAEMAHRALQIAEEQVAEHLRRAGELQTLRDELAYLMTAMTEMRKLRQTLNATIGPDLATRASEDLALLTDGRYDTIALDGDFLPILVEDGVRKAVISGGEEDVVALALRLALSELIQERQGRPMSLLILDEVFGSLDTDRRQAVLDRLTALKGRFQQILVISHIEEINQVADQCLYLSRSPETRATVVGDVPAAGFGELL